MSFLHNTNAKGTTTNDAPSVSTGLSRTSNSKKRLESCLTRTVILRTILVSSLLLAAATCASVAYIVLRNTERQVGIQTYNSIATMALNGAQAITVRKVQGSNVMSTLLGNELPNADDWPFINVPGYIAVSSKVAELSSSNTQSLMVFLDPYNETSGEGKHNVTAWEEHTQQVYRDQRRPNRTGFSDFGFGIWKNDKSSPYEDGRVHDTTGETTWGGTGGILAPLMMHNVPGASSSMYNVYSESNRGVHIDSMFDCVKRFQSSPTPGEDSPGCAVITDMLELKIRPGPAGLLFNPVYPANEPTTLVGFATTSIHWQEVLDNVVPSYVSGLTCVVSTATKSYTYEIREGKPELVGDGDLHDDSYTSYAQSAPLTDFINTGSATSAKYTLTVYPTSVMFDTFSTSVPIAVAFAFFGVILLCTLVFFAYDFLMRHEANERKLVLEMKRKFVRFISHEIRTPLNTVCMGLELLESEFRHIAERKEEQADNAMKDDISFWQNVTTDVRENASIAVSILNDLLNYDKLEQGTLKMEYEPVPIWDLIAKTVQQFNIQAVNKQIEMDVDIQRPELLFKEDCPDLENGKIPLDVGVMGDDVRLSQVVRNVISNALKFTPIKGGISVSAAHIPDGLPNAEAAIAPQDLDTSRHWFEDFGRAGAIEIRVKDSGVGLSKEQLGQLFQEGVQFDANRLQHGGGSGLGLNIAKGIVEQHGGTIHAESEGIGKGTTFVVMLPLHYMSRCEKTEATDIRSTGSDISDDDQPVRGRHVLVVEDSVSSQKMLIRLLERQGHTCVAASNGIEAIDEIRANQEDVQRDPGCVSIDTVLMDFEMPVMNGPDAAKRIRGMGYTGHIIGVTGNVLSEDVDYFKANGANEVLAKPVSMASLKSYWDRHPNKKK